MQIEGDNALREMTMQYDCVQINEFKVSSDAFIQARSAVKDSTVKALERAIAQLSAFHSKQKTADLCVETSPGIMCQRQSRPIQRVGLYIPAGSAPLVSTVLMLGVPAKIAGNPLRILCTPPRLDGTVDPAILVAAQLCGIEHVYRVGGAQAIAAMAYGTQSIPKVDKIFGPGNAWVTQAKICVSQEVDGAIYDLPAGPSEVLVIADETANPAFVAADLLSQAEHGADSQVLLLCTNRSLIDNIRVAIEEQIATLSRKHIAMQALENSRLIYVADLKEAFSISNEYAPEHLILQIKNPNAYIQDIKCAGSVFLGPWSPESAGDYASGTNHVLPTYGFAKKLSGLSINDFMTYITFQELTQEGLADIAPTIAELTGIEGLDGHQRAIDIRLEASRTRS